MGGNLNPNAFAPNTYITGWNSSTSVTLSQYPLQNYSGTLEFQVLLANEAAVDFPGVNIANTQPNSNVIENILIEAYHYPFAFRADFTSFNIFIGNSVQDQGIDGAGANTYLFTQNATSNILIAGYHDDTYPITDLNGANTIINHPAAKATFGQPVAVTTPASVNIQGAGQSATQFQIVPVYAQSSNASATDLLVNRTENTVGSGPQNLIDLQVAGASKFKIDHLGSVTFKTSLWHTSDEGQTRLFFEQYGNSYYEASLGHTFRTAGDVNILVLGSDARLYVGAPNSAPTDTNIANSRFTFYLDETNNALKVRVRYSNGTLKTGSIPLT